MGWFGRTARWDADLYVEVSPEVFIFRTPRETFECATVVGATTATGIRLLGSPDYAPPATTIPLFPSTPQPGPAPARYDHLRAFLNQAIVRSADKRMIKIKPRVVLHGAVSLDPVLHGYQYDLLRRATLEAGARLVRFTEKAPHAPPQGFEMPVSLPEIRMQMQGYYRPPPKRRFKRFRRGGD